MKIAIIGSGISGLSSAYYLSENHDVTLFEKESRIGGHTATKDIELENQRYAIDTGFIVFNDWTYPNFIRLLAKIGVPWRDSIMSFSVSCEESGLEYAGSNLKSIFAQKRNLFSFYFLRMLKDILRFNKQAPFELENGDIDPSMPLSEYLRLKGYSKGFINHYLVPMGAAIWSSSHSDMLNFPVQFFVRFFKNHGLLSVKYRPVWKTVVGGSRSYIDPLTQRFKKSIVLNAGITSVNRRDGLVSVSREGVPDELFDEVIFACHSDEAMDLLADANELEQGILSAIPYEKNDVVLHTDSRLLPKHKLARSSWNYSLKPDDQKKATLTYCMNTLQGIESKHDFLVSLNQSENIDKTKILGSYSYDHPQFTLAGMEAQERWSEINGVNNTWFCGAYWRNGFHEDGVYSALRVVNGIQGESEATKILHGKARPSDLAKGERYA